MQTHNLIIRGLGFSWNGTPVFNDLSLSLHHHRLYILRGENASGKTTLLKLLAGLLQAQSGIATLAGVEYPLAQSAQRLRRLGTYMHQHSYFFDTSVQANAYYALKDCKLTRSQQQQRVAEALKRARLWHRRFDAARSLSGGQQQRLALARVWLRDVPFVFLDEPMSQLDADSRADFIHYCKALHQQRRCVVISSHESCAALDLPMITLQVQQKQLLRMD